MPIGIGTAVTAGAAVLGAGASIYSSSKASDAQTKAANQASGVELQVAEQNNQLARDMYGQNAARLDPYSSMGLAAGDEYMGLLLGHAPARTTGSTSPNGWVTTPPPAALPTTGSSGAAGPSTLADIARLQNDGIPGNYASALSAYYGAHPPTSAEIAAMKNDGIPGNYAAATSAAASHPASALAPMSGTSTIAQQAQQAIAAGADPAAVRARAATYGVHL